MEATALSLGKSVLDGALGYAKSAVAEEVVMKTYLLLIHLVILLRLPYKDLSQEHVHGNWINRSYGEEHKDLGNQHGPGEEQGGRLCQVGGPTQFGIVSLGLQDQSAPISSPRSHTDSVFDAPHMPGKLTS